jgi:hypothetical protein
LVREASALELAVESGVIAGEEVTSRLRRLKFLEADRDVDGWFEARRRRTGGVGSDGDRVCELLSPYPPNSRPGLQPSRFDVLET